MTVPTGADFGLFLLSDGKLEQPVEIAYAQRAKNKNRARHARPPQNDAFLDIGAREHRRARLFESQRHSLGSMTVRIRFDDCNHRGFAGIGSAREKLLNGAEVRLQRREIDARHRAADHREDMGTPDPIRQTQPDSRIASARAGTQGERGPSGRFAAWRE